MQIKGITVNAAGMAVTGRDNQESRNQVQMRGSLFGPECKVTISREGRNLSGRQTSKSEVDARNAQSVRTERTLLRKQEEMELAMEAREGYREELNEIDEKIKDLNTSYTSWLDEIGEDKEYEKDAMKTLMEKTVRELKDLKKAMAEQERFETEEAQKRVRAAQQMAMQRSGRYQGEIDENNRELTALLKTMEEAEKAEERREGNGTESEDGTSGTGESVSDAMKNSAFQFMTSSADHEKTVEEMLAGIGESGHFFLDKADTVTRNVLQKSADIRAALDSESFTDEQIEGMMQKFREEMELNYKDVKYCRSFGLDVLRKAREAGIEHTANGSAGNMQKMKDAMMVSALDAALGEARQGSLDEASRKLEDEVERLIDERNDIGRIPKDKEEDEEEQNDIQKEQL